MDATFLSTGPLCFNLVTATSSTMQSRRERRPLKLFEQAHKDLGLDWWVNDSCRLQRMPIWTRLRRVGTNPYVSAQPETRRTALSGAVFMRGSRGSNLDLFAQKSRIDTGMRCAEKLPRR